jgi:hypothetical protein
MRLGTLLLRDAVIGLSQLEEALKAQILYGGRLGTNLVELGLMDLDTLGLYLAKVHGVPVATQARMEAADPGTVARLGRELAERHLAFPLGPEPLRPETIAIAMSDPRQPERIGDIQRALGTTIAPYAAAELRILYYLERHYQIERRPRFLRPADASAPPIASDRRRTQPAPGQAAPVVRFEPRARRAETAPPPGDVKPPARSAAAAASSGARSTYETARRAIATAQQRDQIADAWMNLAEGRLAAALLFIVRGQAAMGWRGMAADGKRLSGAAVERLAVPLGGSSVLQVCFDTARPHHGPSPTAGRPIERQIWEALAVGESPEIMLVVPVVVGQRVVNLFYGHAPVGRSLGDAHVRELCDLAGEVAAGYARLIQSARIDRLVR